MIATIFRELFHPAPLHPKDSALPAEFTVPEAALRQAGLDEAALRNMDPDDRVAALEQARLDPYDYIYLAC